MIIICNHSLVCYLHTLVRGVHPMWGGTKRDASYKFKGGPESTNKYTKFGQLIIRKFIKSIATTCHILSLKCTKFDSSWGSVPHPTGGAYSALSDLLARFNGPYFEVKNGRKRRGMYREGKEERRWGGVREMEGEEKVEEGLLHWLWGWMADAPNYSVVD